MKKKVLVIVGPTGSGKTLMSLRAAKAIGGEIVSADSMQLYRGMNIGTAKLLPEDREGIAHHMIDVVEPDKTFSVSDYQTEALRTIDEILHRGNVPVVCGGSGLYVNSITHNLRFDSWAAPSEAIRDTLGKMTPDDRYELLKKKSPEAAERVHPNNQIRVIRALEIALSEKSPETAYNFESTSDRYAFVIVGISPIQSLLRETLDRRVDDMVTKGLIDEVRELHVRYPFSRALSQAIGYKELIGALTASQTNQAIAEIKRNTKRFSKRQMTWFRRDTRIDWFNEGDDKMLEHIIRRMSQEETYVY